MTENRIIESTSLATEDEEVHLPATPLESSIKNFSLDMAIMIDSGISIVRALFIASATEPDPEAKAIIEDIQLEVESGNTLSRAMSKHPEMFKPFYIGIVKAGEVGGVLEQSFEKLAELTTCDAEELTKYGASRAPTELKHMSYLFSVLLNLGVPLLQCFETLAEQFPSFQEPLLSARQSIREGEKMAEPFAKAGYDPMFVHMITIGEESGALDLMLRNYAVGLGN